MGVLEALPFFLSEIDCARAMVRVCEAALQGDPEAMRKLRANPVPEEIPAIAAETIADVLRLVESRAGAFLADGDSVTFELDEESQKLPLAKRVLRTLDHIEAQTRIRYAEHLPPAGSG
jgi:hypothetical protein